MQDLRTVKYWKVAETMLRQASELLDEPDAFQLTEQGFAGCQSDSREQELTEAMTELEAIAQSGGAKSGFWRRMMKVAEHLGNADKARQYEARFREALAILQEQS